MPAEDGGPDDLMMNPQRLEQLLDLYFDEGLNEESALELNLVLKSSSDARQAFWKRARLNGKLRQVGLESWGQTDTSLEGVVKPRPSVESSRKGGSWLYLSVAACLLIAVGALWTLLSKKSDQVAVQHGGNGEQAPVATDTEKSPISPPLVAVLLNAVDVQWVDAASAPQIGEPFSARQLLFSSGLIELQTIRGATIVVEGPADLHVLNEMEVRCQRGRLSVDVPPPAIGFLVHTPAVNVVDLGTAFAMYVDDQEKSEVHVLEGKVELVSPTQGSSGRELLEGQAVGVAKSGAYEDIPVKSGSFPTIAQVSSRAITADQQRLMTFHRRRAAITQDPSCLVYYDFSASPEGNTSYRKVELPNLVVNPPFQSNGTIVGCARTEGRWPGKQSLEFKKLSDRVLLAVPGMHEEMTCIATVRLDSINWDSNPLLVSSSQLSGGICWQISRAGNDPISGQLRFDRNVGRDGTSDSYISSPVLRQEQLGAWMQVAFVWDGLAGTCSQYVDGKLVSEEQIQSKDLMNSRFLQLGDLQVGNGSCSGAESVSKNGNLCGRMDELAIFARAFSPTEVKAHHDFEKIHWTGGGRDGNWLNPSNWAGSIVPKAGDNLALNITEAADTVFNTESLASLNLNAIHVGYLRYQKGALSITGGTLIADNKTDVISRVGVAGGEGVLAQTGGNVRLNALQVGLDADSKGIYRLRGGTLSVSRVIHVSPFSLNIGEKHGEGSFEISGGTLETRRGIAIGNGDGVGSFYVLGSGAQGIRVGSLGTGDGSWMQCGGSTLGVAIDDGGVTKIFVDDFDDGIRGGDVTFEKDAVLDVSFVGNMREGFWDIMSWEGNLIDRGLKLAPTVDPKQWQFEFVDTDNSGNVDTLRVKFHKY